MPTPHGSIFPPPALLTTYDSIANGLSALATFVCQTIAFLQNGVSIRCTDKTRSKSKVLIDGISKRLPDSTVAFRHCLLLVELTIKTPMSKICAIMLFYVIKKFKTIILFSSTRDARFGSYCPVIISCAVFVIDYNAAGID